MRRFSATELLTVFVSVLVSLASAAISLNGNRTQERLLAASVWPNLSFDTGNAGVDDKQPIIDLSVRSTGNGPVRIKNFWVEYGQRHFASASTLMDACCGLRPRNTITSPPIGKVLRPGDEVRILQVALSSDIDEGWHRLDRERFKVVLSACYCSTLNECWIAASNQSDPVAVTECSDRHLTQWRGG